VTGDGAASDRRTVKTRLVVPLLPSATVASLITSWRVVSSSKMVPKAELSPRVAPVGLLRVTLRNSSPSTATSLTTLTVIV
jgi:hypothetical protein